MVKVRLKVNIKEMADDSSDVLVKIRERYRKPSIIRSWCKLKIFNLCNRVKQLKTIQNNFDGL